VDAPQGRVSSDEAKAVLPGARIERLFGLGGTMTDAAAAVYERLSGDDRKRLLDLYFGPLGLGYTLGRVTFGSCDFSPVSYDLLDSKGEVSLENAAPVLRLLKDIYGRQDLTLFASSWTPLAKWKDNGDKYHGGHLRPEYIDAYADYYAKIAKSFAKAGYPISYFTAQNEAEATQVWESCLFDPEMEGRLALAIKKRLPNAGLFLWDHNRDALLRRIRGYRNVPGLLKEATGIAYHWYDGDRHDALAASKTLLPDKRFVQTECCIELLNLDPKDPSSAIGRYQGFTRYYEDHVRDLRAGAAGFIDWNLVLDERGGPNHVGNFCEAPIMLDKEGHLRIMPPYYALKHLSLLVKPGAESVETPSSENFLTAGSKDKDGGFALTAKNLGRSSKKVAFMDDGGNLLYETDIAPEEAVTIAE